MRHLILCVLLVIVVCFAISNVQATTFVYDTGEVAMNGTNPNHGDNIITGGGGHMDMLQMGAIMESIVMMLHMKAI
ncbi:MAG: hypothetical protein JRJ86_00985 [Deltaproteobacteria bacterium]|nr:hypothetical protein [Deltaproteobacteria bacterium]MBW2117710.1 hypothetical protein [Deltaproteobacteria bacterium]MBW2344127.1 hypothetical protein [Deltaproteobacteria bacterium]